MNKKKIMRSKEISRILKSKPDEYVARTRTNEKYLAVVIMRRFIERVKTMIEIEKEKFEHSGSRHFTAPNFYI